MPKVSFITAVKNRPKELEEMIQSILRQDMSDWEAVIVDDHSTEDIQEIVQSFNDKRIKFLKQSENKQGVSAARNLAINYAQSEILLTADGDDINRSQRARTTFEIMTKNRCDVFYSNLEYFIPEENKKWRVTFQPFNSELFKMFNFMTNPGTAFRKEIYFKVGGFDDAFKLSEDYDLYLRMLNQGAKFCYTEDVLVDYRRSSKSTSNTNFSEMHSYIMKTRIKNNIPPFNIEDVKKYAHPAVSEAILTGGRGLWQDDRFERGD